MRPLKDVIKELRQKHGNKAQVARKIGISSQLLGRYESGVHEPKIDFFEAWEKHYGEDIREIQKGAIRETNVSHETKNGTQVDKRSDNKEYDPEEREEVYRTIVEGNTEYVLIPRVTMNNAEIVSKKQLDATIRKMDNDSRIMEILMTKFVAAVDKVMESSAQAGQAQKRKHSG